MDAFYPFVSKPLLPGEPRRRLIAPVSKYTRIMPLHPNREFQRNGQVDEIAADAQHEHGPSHHAQTQPKLLQTSHAETPVEDQHVDADGHLDLYV